MVYEDAVLFKGNPNIVYPRAPGRGISFKCFKCPSIFDRKEALLTHSSLHGANKKFKCHMCDYSVNSSELLSKHMSKHKNPPKFASSAKNGSPTDSKSPSTPKYSPSNISPSSTFKCSECPAIFSDQRHLRTHRANHNSGQSKKCHKCSFSTRRRDLLDKHLLVHGPCAKEASPLPSNSKDGHLSCPECPDAFRSQREFSRHMDKHGAGDKFACTICTFSVNRQDWLQEHESLHSGTSSPARAKKTSGSRELRSEEATGMESLKKQRTPDDADDRAPGSGFGFKCSKCPFTAPGSNTILKHESTHGGSGIYRCSYCDYTTNTYTYKFNHEQLHQKQFKHRSGFSKIASKIASKTLKASTKFQIKNDAKSTARPRASVPQEEFERLRKGNPQIRYEPRYTKTGGRKFPVKTYKCFNCPYQTHDYSCLAAHEIYHEGTKRKSQCSLCSFSIDSKKKLAKHLLLHGPVAGGSKKGITKKPAKSPAKVLPMPIIQRVSPRPQNTRDHTNITAAGIPKSFNELYSTEAGDKSQLDKSKYLVERLKVSNFMSIEKFDLNTTNILTFQGKGKSASLAALLVGLGYDLLMEDYTPDSLCGVSIHDFVRTGSDESSIELILSLHAAPKLEREYGSHLRLIRKLERGLPLLSTCFQVASADVKRQFPNHLHTIGKQRLRRILKHLGITPQFFRLLLLDEVNLRHVLKHPSSWYEFYRQTYTSRKAKLDACLQLMKLKHARIQGEVEWRKEKERFLQTELDSSSDNPWRVTDEEDHKNLTAELVQIYETQNAVEAAMNSYLNELNKLSNTLTGRLKFRFQEFLHRQNYSGSILVDDKQKILGIWIQNVKEGVTAVTPKTVEEVKALWESTPNPMQRLAVIGLFFALIDIAESPIFFMDASSSRSTEFSLPSVALPLLFELIEKKCSQGHQFVTSLSDQSEAFASD